MLKHIDTIEVYLNDIDENSFLEDVEKQDACLMRLIVIGEHTTKLSEEVKQRFPGVDWKAIKTARNFYVHVYDGIEWERIWKVFKTDLNILKADIIRILGELNNKDISL